MSGELRALGAAHGLLLGLMLASPLVAPDLLPWGVQALFLLAGFQLRLADRRWSLREGVGGWISHIRMAPRRLIPWGAAAVVARIAGDDGQALAILIAATSCELLVYPMVAHLLGRLPRHVVGVILLALIVTGALTHSDTARHMLTFLTGIAACLVWLRGPDGEPRALALALGGTVVSFLTPMLIPAALPFAFLTGLTCATWALAHLSVLRRSPLPWRNEASHKGFVGLWQPHPSSMRTTASPASPDAR